jgi:hypothetical protein
MARSTWAVIERLRRPRRRCSERGYVAPGVLRRLDRREPIAESGRGWIDRAASCLVGVATVDDWLGPSLCRSQ